MKKLMAILLCLLMVLSMAACGGNNDNTENLDKDDTSTNDAQTTDEASSETIEIAFSCPICSGDTYWNSCFDGMQDAAEEIGNITVNMVGPASLDLEQWVKDTDSAIASGYDAIITSGVADVIRSSIVSATSKDIPVALIDTDLDAECGRFCYIGLDNVALGKAMADTLNNLTDGAAKVCIVSLDSTALNMIDRIDGFTQQCEEKYPNIEIVTVQNAADAAAAVDITGQVLNGFPEVNAFVCIDGTTPKGCAQALAERGLTDSIVTIGMTDDQQIVDQIRDGSLTATIALQPYEMGYQAVKNIVANMNGEEVEEIVIPDSIEVTKDNIEEFAQERGWN